MLNRRHLLKTLTSLSAALIGEPAYAQTPMSKLEAPLPKLLVSKDPNCGCCGDWVKHMQAAGFPVEVIETANIGELKARVGVPQDLAACHTAQIDGYVIEGHVPAAAVKRLLRQRPAAKGLATPGMPLGSPGMEVSGQDPDVYEVILFGPAGRYPFAKYKGLIEL
jgi:hypothetical protein